MEVTCQGKECTQISSMLPLGQAQKWHLYHSPSDLQPHQLCETPSSLTAALSAPCHQDGDDTHSHAPLC